jgi:hypothetical protein
MENLLTVLKTLGKKMTGVDITGNNLVAVVDNIADNYAESGEHGNNSVFIINTVEQTGDNTFTYDVEFSDVVEAFKSGKILLFREWTSGRNYYHEYNLSAMGTTSPGNPSMFEFSTITNIYNNSMTVSTMRLSSTSNVAERTSASIS